MSKAKKDEKLADLIDRMNEDTQEVEQARSDMEAAMSRIDDDSFDKKGNTKLDFNTNLSDMEIEGGMVWDELVAGLFLAPGNSLFEKKKRLNKSKDGDGLNKKVQMATGIVEQQQGATSFMRRLFGKTPEAGQ